jgi:hydroxyethylthiazole kinase-like uncharacterized protein yjeF
VASAVLTVAELREVEGKLAGMQPALMERAGRATAEAARRLATDTGARILVIAGPGNNGGDAWVAAAELQGTFHKVVVLDVAGTEPKAAQARTARAAFVAAKGDVVREWPAGAAPHATLPGGPPALIVDGLLGIGLTREVAPPLGSLIERMNAAGVPILAIDVPSGLDSETGCVLGVAVRATHTITFIAHKAGLHTADGPDHCGIVTLEDLGATEEVAKVARGSLVTPRSAGPWLRRRERNSHKGDFGTLGIVGGNRGMVGAALLAGRAALLAGAGKVQVGLLAPDAPQVDFEHPELMLRPMDDVMSNSTVLVMGPGAGQSPSVTSISMFERQLLPSAIASNKPLVLDADALNTLAVNNTLRAEVPKRAAPTLLTPHPAEAGRLLNMKTAEVQADRRSAAAELARRLNAFVVLKGVGSICAAADGRWAVNTTGNPGLASGGTGDVLAGILGALLCQGLEPWQALQYGVCLHGAAADSLVARGRGPIGLTASEISLEARRLLNLWTTNA